MTRRATPRAEGAGGRRRPRWGEFRDAYPRIVVGMVVLMAFFLAADAVLAWRWMKYRRQTRDMRASLNAAERGRLDLLLETTGHRAQLMMEVARREAIGADTLNLAVSLEDGVMYLQRDGARLREMKVQIGPEIAVGAAPGAIRIAAPRGKRTITGILSGSYDHELPSWVWMQRGQAPPANRRVPGALGQIAVLLSGGSVIYSSPAPAPLDGAYLLPGSVRADPGDLAAISENLKPGQAVFFH